MVCFLRATSRETNAIWDGGATKEPSLAVTWHRKMGHLNYRDLGKCYRNKAVIGLKFEKCPNDIFCDVCARGKINRAPKKSDRIGWRLTVSHMLEQSGVTERKNRTLLDMARCLLLQSSLSISFWAEAINTVNYIRNRCPTSHLDGRTPFQV